MIEEKHDKQVLTRTGGPLKKKNMLRQKTHKQVRTSTVKPLKKKYMFRYKKIKRLRTYDDIVSTGKLSNKGERGKYFK